MPAVEPARERIARRLQDAVDRLHRDIDEVEFWTEVLGCLAQPAPDYSDGTDLLNRFILPPESPDRVGETSELDPQHRPEETRNHVPEGSPNRRHSGH